MALETLREYLERGGSDDLFVIIKYQVTRFKEYGTSYKYDGRAILDQKQVEVAGGEKRVITDLRRIWNSECSDTYLYSHFKVECYMSLSDIHKNMAEQGYVGYLTKTETGIRKVGYIV